MEQISFRFPGVMTDTFVVMPDHIHGVLISGISQSTPVGKVVRWFKSTMFTDYTSGVNSSGWQPYDRKLWQRNFYDHIVRNDDELNRIRRYIAANPGRWQARLDEESLHRL